MRYRCSGIAACCCLLGGITLAQAPNARPLRQAGDQHSGVVEPGKPVTVPVSIGAGQFFHVQVNGSRMVLRLLDPAGTAVFEEGTTAVVRTVAAGEYRIQIETRAPAAQQFRITVLRWRAEEPGDAVRVEAIRELNAGYREAGQATAAGRSAALTRYAEALRISRTIPDPWLEARCLQSQAITLGSQGQLDGALSAYNDAIRIYRSMGDPAGESGALNAAALLYAARYEFDAAFEYYRQALTIHRRRGSSRSEAEVMRNLAMAQASAGNLTEAQSIYEDTLARFRALGDRYQEAVTLVQLGEYYLNLGDYAKAAQYARNALPLHTANADRTARVHTLTNIGQALAAQGMHSDALVSYYEALRIARDAGLGWQEAGTRALAAVSEQALGRLTRAEAMYRESLGPMRAHGNRNEASRLLTHLSLLELQRNQFQDAGRHLDEALTLALEVSNPVAEAMARHAQGQLAHRKGDFAAARTHVERALTIVEGLRSRVENRDLRASFLAMRGNWYEFYVDLLMDMKNPEAALAGVERARARGLVEMLTQVEGQHESNDSVGFRVADMRARLDGETAILAYALGERRSWLFVLTREGVTGKRLPPAQAIAADVRQIRDVLSRPGRAALGRYVHLASTMYRECVLPGFVDLTGVDRKKRLVISADGPLHYLPFGALLTGTNGDGRPLATAVAATSFADLPYLIRRWDISYAPSATAYLTAHPAQKASRERGTGPDLVVFADPAGDLPGAAREAAEIAKQLPDGKALVLRGSQATHEVVFRSKELPRTRWVHFATHGTLAEGSGAATSIALARGRTLTTSEVLRLRWQAELVVLSGCETGIGPQMKGEGILGMQRAFLFAGVSTVMVSLWAVSDESTAALMAVFYGGVVNRSADPAAALREAKLAVIRRGGAYSHPYYWAPFVATGRTSTH